MTKKWSERQAIRDFLVILLQRGYLDLEDEDLKDIYELVDQFLGIDMDAVQREGRK